jgi:hypothetical protein
MAKAQPCPNRHKQKTTHVTTITSGPSGTESSPKGHARGLYDFNMDLNSIPTVAHGTDLPLTGTISDNTSISWMIYFWDLINGGMTLLTTTPTTPGDGTWTLDIPQAPAASSYMLYVTVTYFPPGGNSTVISVSAQFTTT